MTFAPLANKPPVNPNLMRQLKSGKSGVSATKTEPVNTGYANSSGISLSDEHPAQEQLAKDDAIPQKPAPQGAPKPSRFGNLAASSTSSEEDQQPKAPAEKAGRFDSVADLTSTPRAKQAKVNIAAVKALTPLVAAIAFKPGNRTEPALKSEALASLVSKVQESTTDVAMAMGPYFANNDWARGQIMVSLSTIAAQQWEKHGVVDIEDIGHCMSNAFRNPSLELQSALASFDGSDQYKEANSEEVAKARLSVTVCSAAWELNDWVTHERLRLQAPNQGDISKSDAFTMPSRVFSYGLPVSEVVEALLGRIIDESRAFELPIQSADLRLAHLQGTVRRMAQIAGAEYVTQTTAIHQWTNEAPNEEEHARRQQIATEQFHTLVLPRVIEWARTNFAAVESGAQRILNEMTQEPSNDEKSRHAAI